VRLSSFTAIFTPGKSPSTGTGVELEAVDGADGAEVAAGAEAGAAGGEAGCCAAPALAGGSLLPHPQNAAVTTSSVMVTDMQVF